MRPALVLLLLGSLAAGQAPPPVDSVRVDGPTVELTWSNAVPGDAALLRVVEIERRASLTHGEWEVVSPSNFSGLFEEAAPPGQGFYRLRTSALPFAMVGPFAETTTQGLRLETPGTNEVVFFGPVSDPAGASSSMDLWLDDVFRGTLQYTPGRAGEIFRYGSPDGSFSVQGVFSNQPARLYSPAFLKARATLATEAGAAAARSLVTGLVARYPDSVTVWQNVGGASTNEATVLYVRAQSADTNQGARPGQFGNEVAMLAQPLASGALLTTVSTVAESFPFDPQADDAVNLNATNPGRTLPFVGRRTAVSPAEPVTAAKWVYVGSNNSPTNATNPPVARYAFWVEDESFKVNVNVATNGPRGTNRLGLGPHELRIDGPLRTSTNPAVASADTAALVSTRGLLGGSGFPTIQSAAAAAGVTDPTALAEFRFLTTVNSAGLDLSRGGFQRFNINSLTNGDKRTALSRLTAAITNTNAAPLFGQRFYRLTNDLAGVNATNAVTPHHSGIYLQKIAANIYDYIDEDDQPTVINNDAGFTLRTGRPSSGITAIGGALDGSNSIVAMGVENVPRLQEYAVHARLRSLRHNPANPDSFGYSSTSLPVPTSAAYEVWIDHYFEFWNPGTRDITLTNAFLKVLNQPGWGTNVTGPLSLAGRDTSEIPLGNVTFRAGRVTVVTTAPAGAPSIGDAAGGLALIDTANAANVVYVATPDNDRVFTGTTSDVRVQNYSGFGGPVLNYNRLFVLTMRGRSSGVSDYQSGMLLGNDGGLLESFYGLPIGPVGVSGSFTLCVSNSFLRDGLAHMPTGGIAPGNNDNLRGGSLLGNQYPPSFPSPHEGDPRALLEQLEFFNTSSISDGARYTNVTRFFNTIGEGQVPGTSTFGVPNTNFVFPAKWTDFSSVQPGVSNAPLVVGNAPMRSIGELGHITDPARPYYTAGEPPSLARGGGRTLRVGQPELAASGGTNIAWYENLLQTNASRTWTSWRLADVFTTRTNTTESNTIIPGLINPNGFLRDNGAALRAALFGLAFLPSPDGSPNTAGRALSAEAVVTSFLSRLTNGSGAGLPDALNPLWERGEISELPVFNAAGTNGLAPGAAMSVAFDRGREEVVRRSIEMITTRGSVFTAYVIGQAIQVTPSATNVVGETRLRSTFEITPQFPFAPDDGFFPSSPVQTARRFSSPTNYSSQALSSEVD